MTVRQGNDRKKVDHRMRIMSLFLFLFFIWSVSMATVEKSSDSPNETTAEKDARMQWWRDARFGMFIHWGLYAIPAGQWEDRTDHAEWILTTAQIPVEQYEAFCPQFNPVKFNASEWVRMAKEAGMKYLVITSKHHDGFCLWDSKVSDYDVAQTPFKRDILKELAVACKEQDLTLCFYYSIMDWHHSDYLPRRNWEKRSSEGADYQRYISYMKAQLKELITRYDPAVIWFDGEWEDTWTHDEGLKLYDYVRSLKPEIIINNRVDKGRRGMQGTYDGNQFAGDFGTPEQEIPATGLDYDWESCMTMNGHWGWNKHDKDFKSTEELIHKLVDIASKGGNYLLNVGPKPDGTFPQESIERLKQIGQWMKVNGQSIYETTASPFAKLAWGRCTKKVSQKGATLYLHVFNWPEDGELLLPGLKNQVKKATFLANHKSVKARQDESGVILSLPAEPLDTIDTVIVVKIKGDIDIQKVLPRQDAAGVVTLPAILSNIYNDHGSNTTVEEKEGKMNIGYWTASGVRVDWSFQIDRPGRFEVLAEVAVADPETKFALKVGDQTLDASAVSTGGYESFQTISLGQMTVTTAGEHKLEICPDQNNWHPLNVRYIQLKLLEE